MTAIPVVPNLREIAALFDLRSDFVHAISYGSGHINDTYCGTFDQAGQRLRYILQRINPNVFKTPIELMENIARVTQHSLARLLAEGHPEARRRTLTCIPAQDGKPYACDALGHVWRVYPFIERARGYDELETNGQAYQAASSFLNQAEVDHLAFAGKLLTLECGIRFLTYYLQGDVYFKIKHPAHNLDRCRNQFEFVSALEHQLPVMEQIVTRYQQG